MIIEIALGIVLAVFILAALPVLLAAAGTMVAIILAGCILLAMVWVGFYLWENSEVGVFVLCLSLFVGILFVIARELNKRFPYLDIGSLMACQGAGAIWILLSIAIGVEFAKDFTSYPAGAIVAYFGGTALLAFALFRWIKQEKVTYAANKMISDSYLLSDQ